jgi:hypothetical protein
MPISSVAKDAKNLAKLYKVHAQLVNQIQSVEAQIKQLLAKQKQEEEEEDTDVASGEEESSSEESESESESESE